MRIIFFIIKTSVFFFLLHKTVFSQNTISGIVYTSDSIETLIGAKVFIKNTSFGTITNIDGRFNIQADIGDTLIVSYTGFNDNNIIVDNRDMYTVYLSSGVFLKEVAIIGSRGKPRTLLETSVPVDIIGPKQIENSPQVELSQTLQYIAPSFHSTKQNISDGTDHIDPVSLRGLGADQTLVLINGKRRHSSSLLNVSGTVTRGQVGTDLNAIPMASVERIEILRDGAAAQYGSDALAGVINIILKKDTNKGKIHIQTGGLMAPPEAPAFLQNTEFNPYANNTLLSNTRGSGGGESFQMYANYGSSIGKKGGFVHVTINYLEKQLFNRMDDYALEVFSDARKNDPIAEYAVFNQGDADAIAQYNAKWGQQYGYALVNPLSDFTGRRVSNVGGSSTTNAGIMYNMEIPINSISKLYSFGGYNYRLGKSTGFFRRPNQEGRQSGLWPIGFSPYIQSDIQDFSFTNGIQSNFKQWNIDFSNSYGSNAFSWNVINSNNASLGLRSPINFHAGILQYTQNITTVDVTREITLGIPFHIAFGTEFRLENFEQIAGQEESWQNYGDTTSNGTLKQSGSQVFPGFQHNNEVDKYRYNSGIYLDIETELYEKWLLGLAGRYENYSDFGNNFSWKIFSRYRITQTITVRGAYSTGFRAPSLPQKYFSSTITQFVPMPDGSLEGVDVAHLNDDSFVTRQFGIQNLKPETSQNISIGFTTQLIKNLSVTVDGYQISIKDRVGITGRFTTNDDPRFATILEANNIAQAQFITNAVDTRTTGLDIILQYIVPVFKGTLTLTGGANFNKTLVTRDDNNNPIIKTGDFLQGFGNQLFNREEISRLEVAQPNNKIILGAVFSIHKITTSLTLTRFGKVEYIHPETNDVSNAWNNDIEETRDQVFSPKTLVDIDISYLINKTVKIGIGSANIFNIYPDRHTHSENYGGGMFPYSRRVTQFGIAGGSYYARLSVNF